MVDLERSVQVLILFVTLYRVEVCAVNVSVETKEPTEH